jgi:hypothetical protein
LPVYHGLSALSGSFDLPLERKLFTSSPSLQRYLRIFSVMRLEFTLRQLPGCVDVTLAPNVEPEALGCRASGFGFPVCTATGAASAVACRRKRTVEHASALNGFTGRTS